MSCGAAVQRHEVTVGSRWGQYGVKVGQDGVKVMALGGSLGSLE